MCPWGLFPRLQGCGRAVILLPWRWVLLSNLYRPIPGHSHSLGIELEPLARRKGCDPPCCSEGWGQAVLGDISEHWDQREGQAGGRPALGQPIHAAAFRIIPAFPGVCLFVWVYLNSSQWQPGTEPGSCCSEQLLGMWLRDGAAHTASGMGWKSNLQLALAPLLISSLIIFSWGK